MIRSGAGWGGRAGNEEPQPRDGSGAVDRPQGEIPGEAVPEHCCGSLRDWTPRRGRAGIQGCSGMQLLFRMCETLAGRDGLGIPWETAPLASGRAGARPVLQTLITTRCHRHRFPCSGSAPPRRGRPLRARGHGVPRGDTSGGLCGALGESHLVEGVRGRWCPDPGGGQQAVLTFSPICPGDSHCLCLASSL